MTVSTSPELSWPWREFLDELGEGLSEPVDLHCIGGFVISLLYGLPRPTADVDYISAIPRYRIEELEQLAGVVRRSSHRNTKSNYNMWPSRRCLKITSLD